MFGVYLMCCTRKFKSPFVMESLVLAILALTLSIFVSIPSVVSNMISAGNFYQFLVSAFSNTEFLIRAIILAVGAVAVFSLRNFGNILRLSHLSSVGRARLS